MPIIVSLTTEHPIGDPKKEEMKMIMSGKIGITNLTQDMTNK